MRVFQVMSDKADDVLKFFRLFQLMSGNAE